MRVMWSKPHKLTWGLKRFRDKKSTKKKEQEETRRIRNSEIEVQVIKEKDNQD